MGVRPAYKQTDVGLIPEEWEVTRLGDVAQIRSGIAKNENASVSDPVRVHYLRVANVQDGFLDLSEMSTLEISRSDLQRFSLLPGDVLMNEGGDRDKLGRGAVWAGQFQPCIHQNHVFVVRSGPRLHPNYLNIWSASPTARRYFLVAGKQTTNLASINKTALGLLPVVVPSTAEQQAISAALGDVDALLDGLDRLIAKKRDLKQAAMQQLLTGQTRLPGFHDEWEPRPLGSEIWDLDAGVSVNSIDDSLRDDTAPRILKTSAVQNGTFLPAESKRIVDWDRARAAVSPRRGTLIISRMNTPELVGECGYVADDHPTLFLPDRLWMTRLAPDARVCARWLAYLLSSSPQKVRIKSLATGTSGSMKNISKHGLLALMVAFPNDTEQSAIAAVLSDMDAELAALEARREKTRALKQAMMQELLTGRIRLV